MRRIVVVAYDRAPTFELSIPGEVFGAPAAAERYVLHSVAGEPGALRTEHGWRVPARARLGALTPDDRLIVAGWRDVHQAPPASLLRLIDQAAGRGAQLVSLCTGAFVLAAAGVLDGQRATTHWRYAGELAQRFPRVDVDAHALFTEGGGVATSAGTVAGVDLCLHLIRGDHGARVANEVARHLVIGAHREGDQAQFLRAPVPEPSAADGLAASLDAIRERLEEPLTVAQLAAAAHLSTRQYLRRFRAATGTTPYRWILSQRVLRARELLEQTQDPIEHVAARCGFRDAGALRTHFIRSVGTTPTRYRAAFGS